MVIKTDKVNITTLSALKKGDDLWISLVTVVTKGEWKGRRQILSGLDR